jgi:hypothetical protein
MPMLLITVSAMPAWPSMLLVLHVFTVQQHCRWILRKNNECICILFWKCWPLCMLKNGAVGDNLACAAVAAACPAHVPHACLHRSVSAASTALPQPH